MSNGNFHCNSCGMGGGGAVAEVPTSRGWQLRTTCPGCGSRNIRSWWS